ncbi:hypothetical protein ACLOJK_035372 [Asimina triloba]
MGDHEGWAMPSGLLPNGLLPNEVASVTRSLDMARWSIAEERTAELISCIQPNQPSEERRNAVADYVQRLIMKSFSCQVFTFGSVPLKTYLPDGDIDLTAFSKSQTQIDTWAKEVRDMLEKEEKSENAEFRVKEVQYIQAEFHNESDSSVQNSLGRMWFGAVIYVFKEISDLKRDFALVVKGQNLAAYSGNMRISFGLGSSSMYGQVLYRFLEFFSNFDWDNFCLSLWGPVPISSLPDMTAESPRRDAGELLLSKPFLDACSTVYAVLPGGQENQGQPFVAKHFNVIDPLRTNNNLGRSVSKGNFFRIRSAFAFGAKRLARLLECPEESVINEVNQFFMNTWERHGSGHRPDAPASNPHRARSLTDSFYPSENLRNHSSVKKRGEHVGSSAGHESQAGGAPAFHGISSQPLKNVNHHPENMSRNNNAPMVSRTQSYKSYTSQTSSKMSDRIARHVNSSEATQAQKDQRNSRPDNLVNEHEGQARYLFQRTRSSPELTDAASEAILRARHNRVPEPSRNQSMAVRPENLSRRKALGGSEVSASHSSRSSVDDPSSLRQSPSHQSLDAPVATDSNRVLNNYHDNSGLSGVMEEELASVSRTIEMNQEEQDLVNMMASSRVSNFGGQVQLPLNLAHAHLPLPISPALLASMGYAQRNLVGLVPANIPLIEPPWGSSMHLPQGLVSSPLSHYFPNAGFPSSPEALIESSNENSGMTDINQEDSDGFWNEEATSTRGFDPDNGSFQMPQTGDKPRPNSGGLISSRNSNSGSSVVRGQQKFIKENRALKDDPSEYEYAGSDVGSVDQNVGSRFSSMAQPSSARSKTASESSWDGSSAKSSKSTRDKRGRKATASSVASTNAKSQSGWNYEEASNDHGPSQADDDSRDWIPLSTVGTEMAERSSVSTALTLPHIQTHQLSSYEPPQISGSDSVVPMAPMLVGSGPRQRGMDNSGLVPLRFYPTGPPVPFLTMLPVYNFPPEAASSDGSTSHFDRDDGQDNSHVNRSDQNFESAENHDQSPSFTNLSSMRSASIDPPEEQHKSDILNSDFASHWQNLQYGRFCQNSRYNGPLLYPSPVVVPPVYLQGHFPWDGPGRPLPANVNLVTQLMGYGPRLVPVAPLQPGSNQPGGVYPRYGDEAPRYRSGTGTYLPTPKASFRERQSSSSRNHRGNHNSDRNDPIDREGHWNLGSKSRAAGRNHWRNQADKTNSRPERFTATDNRTDRQWDSYRHENFTPYQVHNGPLNSNSMQSSNNMAYGLYSANSNGIAPTGPAVPPFVLYGYGSPAEQLEFGSLGPMHFSSINEPLSPLGDGGAARGSYAQRQGTFEGGSPVRSSPDQPSSPQRQRSAAQRNYQLKDDDFPPLSFQQNQGGSSSGGVENSCKTSHYQTAFLFNPHS